MPEDPLQKRLDDIQGALEAQMAPPPLRPLPDREPPTPKATKNEIEVLRRIEYAARRFKRPFEQPGFRESMANLGEGFKNLPAGIQEMVQGLLEPTIPGVGKTINQIGEDLAFKLAEKVQGTPRERAERLYGENIRAKIARRGPIQYDQGGRANPSKPTGRKFR